LACKGIRGQGSKTVSRKAKEKTLFQTVEIPDTNAGIFSKLKEDMSKWRKYSKAEAEEDRKTLLQKKATPISEEKNSTMENIMKQLRLRQAQKRSATQIKMVSGKLRSGGISRATYLDENGVVHESTGREHLEELYNKANEAKLQ
jgi:hypothetical protein